MFNEWDSGDFAREPGYFTIPDYGAVTFAINGRLANPDYNGVVGGDEQYQSFSGLKRQGYAYTPGPYRLPTTAEFNADPEWAWLQFLVWNGYTEAEARSLPKDVNTVALMANNIGFDQPAAAAEVARRLGVNPAAVQATQEWRKGYQASTAGGGFLSDVGELLSVQGPLGITAGMVLAAAGAYAYAGAAASTGSALDAGMNVYDVSGWSPTGGASALDAGMDVYDVTNFNPVYDTPTLPNVPNVPTPGLTTPAPAPTLPATPGTVIQAPVVTTPTPGILETVKQGAGVLNTVKSAAGLVAAAMGSGGAASARPTTTQLRPVVQSQPQQGSAAPIDFATWAPLAAVVALALLKG